MKRHALILSMAVVVGLLAGCTPIERQAYNSIVASKAFLDSIKVKHPECPGPSKLCISLTVATAAKDTLIDAAEEYCASKSFDAGGPCTPPNKSDAKYQQLADKLQGALNGYKQAQTDLKGLKP